MKPINYSEEDKEALGKSFSLDPVCGREEPCLSATYVYTDVDNDEIRKHIIDDIRSKILSSDIVNNDLKLMEDIVNNPTCLEPIDLIEMSKMLQSNNG